MSISVSAGAMMGVGAGMGTGVETVASNGQRWNCRLRGGFLGDLGFWVVWVVRARRASAGAWVPVLRGPFGLPCGAPADRGLARTRLRLKQSPALIRSPVRSSATQNRRPDPDAGPASTCFNVLKLETQGCQWSGLFEKDSPVTLTLCGSNCNGKQLEHPGLARKRSAG